MTSRAEQLASYLILAVFTFTAIVPVIGIVLVALRSPDALGARLDFSNGLHFENFARAWELGAFGTSFVAGLIVVIGVVPVTAVVSILAGYAFGTMRFAGRDQLFLLLLIGLMIPLEATVIPLFYGMRWLHWTNTHWALIAPQIGLLASFGAFWMRAYFLGVPRDLSEAARVDGASTWTILWRVLMPNARPAVVTMVVLMFMWTWNQFMLALVLVSDEGLRTPPLRLTFFQGEFRTDYTLIAAGSVIVATPVVVVYVLLQRSFIRGMFEGATKG